MCFACTGVSVAESTDYIRFRFLCVCDSVAVILLCILLILVFLMSILFFFT